MFQGGAIQSGRKCPISCSRVGVGAWRMLDCCIGGVYGKLHTECGGCYIMLTCMLLIVPVCGAYYVNNQFENSHSSRRPCFWPS